MEPAASQQQQQQQGPASSAYAGGVHGPTAAGDPMSVEPSAAGAAQQPLPVGPLTAATAACDNEPAAPLPTAPQQHQMQQKQRDRTAMWAAVMATAAGETSSSGRPLRVSTYTAAAAGQPGTAVSPSHTTQQQQEPFAAAAVTPASPEAAATAAAAGGGQQDPDAAAIYPRCHTYLPQLSAPLASDGGSGESYTGFPSLSPPPLAPCPP